jgi:hypothetical protein
LAQVVQLILLGVIPLWFRQLQFHHSRNHLAAAMAAEHLAGLTSTVEMVVQAAELRFLRQVARAAQGKQFYLLLKDMPVEQTRAT